MKTILIVEDSDNSRELLRLVVERLGHAVVEACNGSEALLRLKEKMPDLILLDLKIPLPNGYEVLQEIRNSSSLSSVPVVALTAYAMVEEREKVLAAGFNGYLSKPIRLAQLRTEVQRLLQEGSMVEGR